MSYTLTPLERTEHEALCEYLPTRERLFKTMEGQLVTERTNAAIKAMCSVVMQEAVDRGIVRPSCWALEPYWSVSNRVELRPVLFAKRTIENIRLEVAVQTEDV